MNMNGTRPDSGCPLLAPPEHFAVVTDNVYRSIDFPNLRFLKTLSLQTILSLTPEKPAKATQALTTAPYSVQLVHITPLQPGIDSTTSNSRHRRILREALEYIQPQMQPVLLVDPGGLFCGIIRKLMGWNYTSVILEYRSFSGNKSRYHYEEFLETFDVKLLEDTKEERARRDA